MNFQFQNLDQQTRELMLEEIQTAIATDQIYFSSRFTAEGNANWIGWLQEAAQSHDEHWLAYTIDASGAIKGFEDRSKPKGGYTIAHVPHTAAATLADGQFNRFYIAAICRRAIGQTKNEVIVYRARPSDQPRPESQALEGSSLNARDLLDQVRNIKESFKCELLKPNSGLSVKI